MSKTDINTDNMKCECINWARVFDPTDQSERGRHHPRCDKRIRVFIVNDCEWVASTSPQEARRWFLEDFMGESLNTGDEYCDFEPEELSESEMERLTFHDPEKMLGVDKTEYTFKEALSQMIKNGEKGSFYFATTEI